MSSNMPLGWQQHTGKTFGACTPKTCAQLARSCGDADDGCGGTLHCGACAPGQTCVGGGCVEVPSSSGKAELTYASCMQRIDANMNMMAKESTCKLLVDPSVPVATLAWEKTVYESNGWPNAAAMAQEQIDARTACKPKTCAQLARSCGAGDDGCGGTLDCGACPAGTKCLAGKCIAAEAKIPGAETCAVQGQSVTKASDCCAGLELRDGKCELPLKASSPAKSAGWILLGTVAAAAVVGLGIWGAVTAFRTNPGERAHNPLWKIPKDFSGKFRLYREPLDSGGYTRSGQYFGTGAPLFYFYSDEDGYEMGDYIRAANHKAAKTKILAMFPGARFYR